MCQTVGAEYMYGGGEGGGRTTTQLGPAAKHPGGKARDDGDGSDTARQRTAATARRRQTTRRRRRRRRLRAVQLGLPARMALAVLPWESCGVRRRTAPAISRCRMMEREPRNQKWSIIHRGKIAVAANANIWEWTTTIQINTEVVKDANLSMATLEEELKKIETMYVVELVATKKDEGAGGKGLDKILGA